MPIHVQSHDTGNQPEEGKGVWNTDEFLRDFEAIGFAAPYVIVKRRADGQPGMMEFTHRPRRYFNFEATS